MKWIKQNKKSVFELYVIISFIILGFFATDFIHCNVQKYLIKHAFWAFALFWFAWATILTVLMVWSHWNNSDIEDLGKKDKDRKR